MSRNSRDFWPPEDGLYEIEASAMNCVIIRVNGKVECLSEKTHEYVTTVLHKLLSVGDKVVAEGTGVDFKKIERTIDKIHLDTLSKNISKLQNRLNEEHIFAEDFLQDLKNV